MSLSPLPAEVKKVCDDLLKMTQNMDRDLELLKCNVRTGAEVLRDIEKTGPPKRVDTGLIMFDQKFKGLAQGTYTILAARTSMGKTSIAGQIAINVARQGKTALYITLEMSDRRIVWRLKEIHGWEQAMNNIYFMQEEHGVEHIVDIAKKLKADVIIIDYIQLIQRGQGASRYDHVSDVSVSLRKAAVSLDCVVLALSQLSRGEKRKSAKLEELVPSLEDLRDSGSLEQDADMVLAFHRDGYYKDRGFLHFQNSSDDHGVLYVLKNRDGPVGSAPLIRIGYCGYR